MTVDENNARRKDIKEELQKIKDGNFCPFCSREYLEKEHPNPIVKETDHWLVTENRRPYEGAMIHLLFIHKKHITDTNEMSKEAWKDLLNVLEASKKRFSLKGGTLLLRHGDTRYNGATVEHLHAQFICGNPEESNSKAVLARVG